jgi:hypothetical protein
LGPCRAARTARCFCRHVGLNAAIVQLERQRTVFANSFRGEPLDCIGGVPNDLAAERAGSRVAPAGVPCPQLRNRSSRLATIDGSCCRGGASTKRIRFAASAPQNRHTVSRRSRSGRIESGTIVFDPISCSCS